MMKVAKKKEKNKKQGEGYSTMQIFTKFWLKAF